MLRFRLPDIFLGAILGVATLGIAIFAMGFELGSSQYPSQSTQSQGSQDRRGETANDQQNETLWHWTTHDAAGFFTLLLVIVGGSQIVLFWVQLRLIRESLDDAKITADAAKESADTAKDALVVSNRAWISIISTSIQSPLTWEEKGARTSIEVNIKNVGKNPAFDIAIEAHQFVMGRTNYDTGAVVNKFRAEVRKRQIARARIGERGEVLLPDESFRISHGLLFAQREITAEAKCEGKVFFPVVVVCVDYRSSITGKRHATCLAYWLGGLSTDKTLTQREFGMGRSPVGSFAD